VSIPCNDAKGASDELIRENLFMVSLKKGLRFAVCAVSEEKCKLAPAIIKKVLVEGGHTLK
jgi:aromatic-amino-acid transaminase